MESKLKLLKVVELKDLLTRAQIPIPARANKPDLIAKIIASPAALNVFDELHGGGSVRPSGANTPVPVAAPTSAQEDTEKVEESVKEAKSDILAPPEPFDWSTGAEPSADAEKKPVSKPTKTTSTKPPSKKEPGLATSPKPKPTPVTEEKPQVKAPEPSTDEDEELKKRRARAERFGIPFVHPQQPQAKKVAAKAPATNGAGATRTSSGTGAKVKGKTLIATNPIQEQDPEKLKARAMRFGLPEKTKHVKPSSEGAARVTGQAKPSKEEEAARVTGQKRGAPTDAVDPEEAERRRKRAERFGNPVKT